MIWVLHHKSYSSQSPASGLQSHEPVTKWSLWVDLETLTCPDSRSATGTIRMQTNVNPQASSNRLSTGRLALALVIVAAFLAIVFVLFSDLIFTPLGGYADQRFFLAAVLGLIFVATVVQITVKPLVNTGTAFFVFSPVIVLSFAFLLLSVPFYTQPYVWAEPGMYAFFFLTMVFAGACLTWSEDSIHYARILVLIVASSCLVYGVASVNVYLFATFDGVTNLVDFIPWGFVNIRYWSHIATWCLPLMPLAVLVGPLKYIPSWRIAVLLGAGMWWWILFLTTSRGSALGIIFGVTVAASLFGRRAFPWLKQLLLYLATGALIWLILSVVIPSFIAEEVQLRTIKTDSSGRMPLFIEAWHMSLQNIPFGMGPQSWLTHETISEAYVGTKKFGHPHNMYLMWAAEYGWLLMGALGFVVAQAVHYFWLSRRWLLAGVRSGEGDEKLLLMTGFTASVCAALFHAGVSAVFMAPGSMVVGLFVLIAFWALITPARLASRSSSAPPTVSKTRVVITLILFAIILVGWLAWMKSVWVYYQDMRLDEHGCYGDVSEGILPRFWFHGNFPRNELCP